MAVAVGVYAQGSPVGSDKEWYHGELSRVEAEQVLAASGCDCFLVRVSEGALILSLIHHGQLYHINIKYGRGWYELENGEAPYTLTELEELVSYYCDNQIKGLQVKLGAACTKAITEDQSHLYESIDECDISQIYAKGEPEVSSLPIDQSHLYESIDECDISQIYAKGEPEDLIKHSWYHGNITREQAEAALRKSKDNGFLVRVSDRQLVLSKKLGGWLSHDVIHYSPKGYRLDGKDEYYESVSELITHYQHHSIKGSLVLGTAIATVPSVRELEEALAYEAILFTKEDTSLKVKWRKTSNLPVAISAPQVVKIGESVYVGGGMREIHGLKLLYKFDMTQETWTALPSCPTYHHALTALNGDLIAIGGKAHHKAVNTVYTFKQGEWINVLPSMITPRYLLAALSHKNRFLIEAGGQTLRKNTGKWESTDAVEIYSTANHSWYSTNPLLFPIEAFAMCSINETCYILGGNTYKKDISVVLYSQMPHSLDNNQELPWRKFNDEHPLCYSTPLELDGKLVALGGSSHPMHRSGTKYVSVYDYASDTWMECKGAQLPIPLYRAGVVKLNSDHVMTVGGQSKMQHLSAAVYIGKSYKARK